MTESMQHVRLLLLGDAGVGKSTLISSFIAKHFPDDVPSVITDSIIPQDKTSNNVTLTILDSSARPGDREILKQKIRRADTILAVFDTTRPETLDNVIREWLPLIRSVCNTDNLTGTGGSGSLLAATANSGAGNSRSPTSSKTTTQLSLPTPTPSSHDAPTPAPPSSSSSSSRNSTDASSLPIKKAVFIVGTKKELLGDAEGDEREKQEVAKVRAVMSEFSFIEGFRRCSSKTLDNVDDIFYLAETAVTFPLGPLYDSDASSFTPACRRALRRIFRIADVDRDGLLSDQELIMLQVKAFGDPLERDQVVNVKKQIQLLCRQKSLNSSNPSTDVGIRANKVTLEGFLTFMELYIERFQPQVPWIILKRFGYDDALMLDVPTELTRLPASIKPYHDQHITELSTDALLFLRDLGLLAAQIVRPLSSSTSGFHEDIITQDALNQIFSVLEPGIGHPWHFPPLFLPQTPGEAENLMILGDFNLGRISLQAWLAHWQLLAMHSPVTVQTLLFRLGYVERDDFGLKATPVIRNSGPLKKQVTTTGKDLVRGNLRPALKVGVLGPRGAGKVSLVCALAGVNQDVDSYHQDLDSISFDQAGGDAHASPIVVTPERSSSLTAAQTTLDMDDLPARGGQATQLSSGNSSLDLDPAAAQQPSRLLTLTSSASSIASPGACLSRRRGLRTCVTGGRLQQVLLQQASHTTNPVSIIATAVPEPYAFAWIARHGPSCDAVAVVFEAGSLDSFHSAVKFEEVVPENVPRFYVASKSDLGFANGEYVAAAAVNEVNEIVSQYLEEHGLPQLIHVSSLSGQGLSDICSTVLTLSSQPEEGIPLGVRRKRANAEFQRKMLRFGLLATALVGIGAFVVARYRTK